MTADASEQRTRLSVRADAQRTVPPDHATLFATVAAVAESAGESRNAVTVLVQRITDALAEAGGEVLTAESGRSALTWSAQSIRTHEDFVDEHAKPRRRSGRYRSSVYLRIAVRDFGLLGRVEQILTAGDESEIHSVGWGVDDDNPGWALVRADAIRAALLKGQDYAAALGGTVESVSEVADAGLLSGETVGLGLARSAVGLGGGGDDTSLDPAPQTLRATIDARLVATIGPVAGRE